MSTNDPGQPEYLGSDGPASASSGGPGRARRRTGLLVGVVAATVVAVGAGAYGVVSLMSGGSSPASAVPASAIGYVSLDLDPSAAQKIEAVRILRKFPGLRSELDISSRDDLRETIFREIQKEGDCKSLDYADDIEPWIGDRVAMAGVPGEGAEVLPLVALQVTDQDDAEAGVRALQKCAGDDEEKVGIASVGDYLLLSENQVDVDSMAEAAGSSALEDDEDFTTWMDRTGDSGIVTMYAAQGAADALVHAADQSQRDSGDLEPQSPDSTQSKQLATAVKDFKGAAGVIRFEDGAVEAEFSSEGLDQGLGGTDGDRGPDVTTLPGTTAAVLSIALQDGWLDGSMDSLRSLLGDDFDSTLTQAEQQTGLRLPEDIETLFGEGVSISVDSSIDPKAIAGAPDPTKIPVGIRIKGDADKITAIIDKLKTAAGRQGDILQVRTRGDIVTVSTDKAYADELLGTGDLGDSRSFTDVVPEADRASGLFFLDFDAGDWAENLADLTSDGDPSVRENLKPLDAFGVSSWQDGAVQHALLRLTTD